MIQMICNDIEVPLHEVPLTISNHQCRFLISQYSIVEISYFIQKKNENYKKMNCLIKSNKKYM